MSAVRGSARAFRIAAVTGLFAVVLTYGNHWSNPFHFDDDHTIVRNPAIRSLDGLPRLLTDARAASVLPTHAVYRPLTYVTLAVDHALAGGLEPAVFHASTFAAFLALIVLLFVLTRRVVGETAGAGTAPGWHDEASSRGAAPRDTAAAWVALATAVLFGVHPVGADTVNYIIQRAEVWSSLGTTAAVVIYAALPSWRGTGLFILPGVLGIFAKTTPASVFPILLALYALVVERDRQPRTWRRLLVSAAAAGGALWVCARMTYGTQSFDPGAPPPAQYLWTQPWIVLRYLANAAAPVDLSIDPGWAPLASPLEPRALIGYAGVSVLIAAAVWTARRRETAAIGFGLGWFLVALVPVSVFPLAEVTNDHRMFLPLAGLLMAAAAAVRPLLRTSARRRFGVVAGIVLVVAAGTATWQRNATWSSHETVWADAVEKNPRNGRAHMNLGVALMARGALVEAARSFEAAVRESPDYALAHVNLGIARGALGEGTDAAAAFERARTLAPDSAVVLTFYGEWLDRTGRTTEAVAHLERAVELAPDDLAARHRLMTALERHRSFARLAVVAGETLARDPGDPAAHAAAEAAREGERALAGLRAAIAAAPTPEGWLDLSLRLYNAADYAGSREAAREAARLRPDYAEAFNNIAAAHAALGEWRQAADAAQHALSLEPDFPLARNNLAWALAELARDDRRPVR